MQKRYTKAEWSWMMYDWANSAHSAIIAAIILPLVYKSYTGAAGIANELADSWWGAATSVSMLAVAVLAPLLGTLGDFAGYKKRLFTAFALLGIAAVFGLAFTQSYMVTLLLYAISNVGFYGSLIYYDGFLLDVTSVERADRVSSTGYALGYVGGSTIPLLFALVLMLFGSDWGMSAALVNGLIFAVTALWWLVFTVPMWKNVQQQHAVQPQKKVLRQTFARLGQTFREIRGQKKLWLFLLAYFFYIDGVGTIIHMATVFGDTLGFGQIDLVLALMTTQLVAIPMAILYGRLASKVGARTMIGVGIATYLVICVLGFSVNSFGLYFLLAVLVGSAQGGLQALSRSYYAKMIPDPNACNEYFGFFDVFAKFASIMGPVLFGFFTMALGHSRYGVLSVAVLFLVGGGLFLLGGREEKKQGAK